MRRLLVAAIILFAFVWVPASHADEASQRAAAEKLVNTITNFDEMMKPLFEHIRSTMEQQFMKMDPPEEMRPILKKYVDKVSDVMRQTMNFQNMREDMIDIYAHSFTEDEMKGMVAFYGSPVGLSVRDKLPAAMQRSMGTMQKYMPELQTKLEGVYSDLAAELEKEMQKSKPVSKTTVLDDNAATPPVTREAKWFLLVGKWFGSTKTREGGRYMWIMDRDSEGSYTIQFRTIDPSGKKREKTETGDWGVSGDVYFAVYKGDIVGDKTMPANPSDPATRDAYRIIALTRDLFVCQHLDEGIRSESRRVPSDFTFPE